MPLRATSRSRPIGHVDRPCPRDGVAPLVVDADGAQPEGFSDMAPDRGGDRSASLRQQQPPAERVQPLEIAPAAHRLDVACPRPTGELARHHRSREKCDERDPVLWVRDGQCADGRQEKEIEAQHREHGRDR